MAVDLLLECFLVALVGSKDFGVPAIFGRIFSKFG